jgi:hypothetical protein
MPQSFDNKKSLRISITPENTGASFTQGGNTIILEGFRATVEVEKAGGVQMNSLQARVYGISQSNMNTLTSLTYQPNEIKRNQISVWAIDGQQETLIFAGNVGNCWANYSQMPDVFLEIQAFAGFINQLTPVPPSSYSGAVDVATIFQSLAGTMGYTFENAGVHVMLRSPYLPGSAWDQAQDLARQAGCDIYLDDNTLVITPSLTPRSTVGTLIAEISAASGLVGYPTFGSDNRGPFIQFSTLFNPAIRFGGLIKMVTSIQPAIANAPSALTPAQRADGQWIVNSIGYALSSETPGGPWFSRVSCGKQRVITTS